MGCRLPRLLSPEEGDLLSGTSALATTNTCAAVASAGDPPSGQLLK
jgi:hypothetical protein